MPAPPWSELRSIGNSTPAKMTLFIPLLGLILMFSGSAEKLFTLSGNLLGVEPEKIAQLSRINLHLLYFGLVLVATATALFNIFCPSIVKMFPSDNAFHDSEMQLMTESRANRIINSINLKFGLKIDLFENAPSKSRADNVDDSRNRGNRRYWLEQHSEPVSNLLQDKYRLEDESRPGLRRGTQVVWVLGFIILAVPSLATLAKICWGLYSNIASI
jgi:hypothetical protein